MELAAVAAQLLQALEEGARAMGEHETVMQAKAKELQSKYDEDVGLLRMQIEEMSEAREVCCSSLPPPRPAPLYCFPSLPSLGRGASEARVSVARVSRHAVPSSLHRLRTRQ